MESTRAPRLVRFLAAAGLVVASGATSSWSRSRPGDLATANRLARYPHARCLDGSPGSYFHRPGREGGHLKFLLFFEGGGFCSSDEECAARALGYFGSTVNDSRAMELTHPFFSRDPGENPLMWSWNHVWVRYCDGGYLSGTRTEAIRSGNSSIFYSGMHVTMGLLRDLEVEHGLGEATDIVFSGCSSGAIHTWAHLDSLRAMLPRGVRERASVAGLPDSGFYLDRPMFTPLKRFIISRQLGAAMLSEACVGKNMGREERCLLGPVAARFVRTPIFAWQSRFDTDQRTCEMSPACAKSPGCVEDYGWDLTEHLVLAQTENPMIGSFVDSCDRHCQAQLLPHDGAGTNPLQAFAAWYGSGFGADGNRSFAQLRDFPCPTCCAPPARHWAHHKHHASHDHHGPGNADSPKRYVELII